MTSRSTLSGDAPGYGTDTTTTGFCTSGNSSVLSSVSAKMPNTASASMTTVVTMGRLMAKSEMNMVQLRILERREPPDCRRPAVPAAYPE
jgi:hypothetical protein